MPINQQLAQNFPTPTPIKLFQTTAGDGSELWIREVQSAALLSKQIIILKILLLAIIYIQGCIQKFQDSTCKRSLLTLDVKFLHHLQSTPLLHKHSGPSVSTMLGSIPGSPFLELCQVPTAIPLESLQWCRIFDPSSKASAWGRGKSHRGPDQVSMGDGGPLSCCSWLKTAKL